MIALDEVNIVVEYTLLYATLCHYVSRKILESTGYIAHSCLLVDSEGG